MLSRTVAVYRIGRQWCCFRLSEVAVIDGRELMAPERVLRPSLPMLTDTCSADIRSPRPPLLHQLATNRPPSRWG